MPTYTGTPGSQVSPPNTGLEVGIEPLPFTKMPLADYARRLGINPVHFFGATMSGRLVENTCYGTWPRYSWQSPNQLSHLDVALAILMAEEAIENFIGIHLAPATRKEQHVYPRYKRLYRTNGVNESGRRSAIQMERGNVLKVGVEKWEYLGREAVVWRDPDGDGYNEIAYLTLTTTVDPREIAIFPAGYGHDRSFQIRYPRWWSVSGSTQNYIIDFWLMIKPHLWAKLPGEYHQPINLDITSNLLTHVDVYRIYIDETDTSAVTFYHEPEPNYESGGIVKEGGLGFVRDSAAGLVAPYWPYGMTRLSPDRVDINYYSGLVSHDWENGRTLNPLSGHLADAVFYLATARLARDLCGCTNAQALATDLRTDMALVSPAGNFLAVADKIQTAPFGTRRGEWLSYQEIKQITRHMEPALL